MRTRLSTRWMPIKQELYRLLNQSKRKPKHIPDKVGLFTILINTPYFNKQNFRKRQTSYNLKRMSSSLDSKLDLKLANKPESSKSEYTDSSSKETIFHLDNESGTTTDHQEPTTRRSRADTDLGEQLNDMVQIVEDGKLP